ncbi:hypothetical protein E2C01_099889 [Portunus trituberculatus]|uniref:Uncharacterized protein n=1 Tax=Portunus trituberculatus TaxID=210409 RepID=A0A5B7KI00_PORTR|nr:hypothetical protein [Portunus trituberculatus]
MTRRAPGGGDGGGGEQRRGGGEATRRLGQNEVPEMFRGVRGR